jgi:hypothetical protein
MNALQDTSMPGDAAIGSTGVGDNDQISGNRIVF